MKINKKKFIYLISPNKIPNTFYNNLKLVLKTGKVSFFQLRLKNYSQNMKMIIGKKIKNICKKNKVKFIINDDPFLTLKVIGSQWFWTYEYSYYETADNQIIDSLSFDSYMMPDNEIAKGCLRLLEVDNRAFLPIDTHVRVLVTATDVLHSWAIPAFGVKTVAVPGRLNETWFKAEKTGIYYGMCSELCGVNHQSMPIEIHVVTQEDFDIWVEEAKSKYASKNNKFANK